MNEYEIRIRNRIFASSVEDAAEQAADLHNIDKSMVTVVDRERTAYDEFDPESDPAIRLKFIPKMKTEGKYRTVDVGKKTVYSIPFRHGLDEDGVLMFKADPDRDDPRGLLGFKEGFKHSPYAPTWVQEWEHSYDFEVLGYENLPDSVVPTDFYRGETIAGDDPLPEIEEPQSKREAAAEEHNLIEPDLRNKSRSV